MSLAFAVLMTDLVYSQPFEEQAPGWCFSQVRKHGAVSSPWCVCGASGRDASGVGRSFIARAEAS
jgi:hypothetical protein